MSYKQNLLLILSLSQEIVAKQIPIPWLTRYIFGNCVSMRFLFLLLLAYITGQIFLKAFSVYGSFILFTKRELSIYILLGIFSGMTNFYLDAVYWDSQTSASLLVNLINLFTIKQISEENIIMINSEYFSDCLQPSLFAAEGADIKSTFTRVVCAGNTCAES